jgi:hypothetical protein
MSRHLFIASSTLLLVALSACGCVTAPEDASCTKVEDTTTILIPADPSNSLHGYVNGQCLDSAPAIDASSRADCFVITARRALDAPTCDASEGLVPVSAEHQDAVDRLRAGAEAQSRHWNTFCELVQLDPASVGGQGCRTAQDASTSDESPTPEPGFCYLDADASPPIGDPHLVETCPENKKRAIRFSHTSAAALSLEAKSLTIVCSREVCSGQ